MSVPAPGTWPTPRLPSPAPLAQPQYGATIGQAVSRFWRKYVVFSGRASRSEFWWWALVSVVISLVLQLVGSLASGVDFFFDPYTSAFDLRVFLSLAPSLLWSLVVLVPEIALSVRRLHDTNRSGWWCLLGLPVAVGTPLDLVGTALLNPGELAVGDLSSLASGAHVAGLGLTILGIVPVIILLVFCVLRPDPRGARFDRRI